MKSANFLLLTPWNFNFWGKNKKKIKNMAKKALDIENTMSYNYGATL
jgi:hypothetical protein